VLEVTRESFPAEVREAPLPVLVDFWGPQCGPCLALMPAVEQLEAAYAGRLKVVKVEAPKNRRLCIDLKVMALPTYLVFVDGQEVRRLTGEGVQRQQLVELAREFGEPAATPA
jgi:thioredoxin 1